MSSACTANLGSATGTFPNSLGEAAEALKALSEPWGRGDKIKKAIERAAHRAGLTYWRAFDLWYGKARRLEDFERVAIAEALERKRDEALRIELHDLRIRLERAEALLVQKDPTFDRQNAHSSREMDGADGNARRAVAVRRSTK